MRVAWGSSSIKTIPRSRRSVSLGIGSLSRVATGIVFHILRCFGDFLGLFAFGSIRSSLIPRYIPYLSIDHLPLAG